MNIVGTGNSSTQYDSILRLLSQGRLERNDELIAFSWEEFEKISDSSERNRFMIQGYTSLSQTVMTVGDKDQSGYLSHEEAPGLFEAITDRDQFLFPGYTGDEKIYLDELTDVLLTAGCFYNTRAGKITDFGDISLNYRITQETMNSFDSQWDYHQNNLSVGHVEIPVPGTNGRTVGDIARFLQNEARGLEW